MTLLAPVNTLRYEPQLCINCEMCVHVCPHGVFGRGLKQVMLVRWSACMECGACQKNCPTGAIVVDSGTGCASAMIRGALSRAPWSKKEAQPTCGET
jgi:NAD-dependent dihydropyrimidine dehydrogenase PreA subunit